MRILLLSQFLSSTKGGGEYLFTIMANELAKRGHKVWIITHKIEDEDYSSLHKNVKVEFVSSIKYDGGLPPSFNENIKYVIQTMLKSIRLVRKENIDLIHSNNFSPALTASIISFITGCPHVTSMWDIFTLCGKDYWSKWANQKGVSKLHAYIGPRFEKLILNLRHSAIHTISEATKEDLMKFGSSKPIYVIPPTIGLKDYNDYNPNNLQFVYVGRLVFYKNVETIIHAISIVKNTHYNVKLKIVGGGPQKKELINLSKKLGLEKNIEFCGYVNEEEKYKIISSSVSMVFPSLCEGFGLVILESFSCDRPVIVSNVRPLCDIINDKNNGLIIEPKDEKKWAMAMIFFIENPEIALRYGQEGRKELQKKYSADNMISQIESMYQKTISSQYS